MARGPAVIQSAIRHRAPTSCDQVIRSLRCVDVADKEGRCPVRRPTFRPPPVTVPEAVPSPGRRGLTVAPSTVLLAPLPAEFPPGPAVPGDDRTATVDGGAVGSGPVPDAEWPTTVGDGFVPPPVPPGDRLPGASVRPG
jgi:hypothetical protein